MNKEEIIKEFDDLYLNNNLWKSDDETMAYAPVDGMRQWIWDKLKEVDTQAKKDLFIKIKKLRDGIRHEYYKIGEDAHIPTILYRIDDILSLAKEEGIEDTYVS